MELTVIIATYNRSADLKICLESLVRQETRGIFSFEVIVADNNSKDRTKDIADSFEKVFPGRIRYVFEQRQGKCYALNTAIGLAKGEIIAFTDDDVQVDPLWLLKLVECFQKEQCDGVGGRILPIYPPKSPSWIKENITQLTGTIVVYDYGTETRVYQKPAYEFLGANYAFKRGVFDDCGMFRTDIGPGKATYGDDTEFVNRAYNAGKRLYYCGEALVLHPVEPKRMSLKYIAQWNIALGRFYVKMDEDKKVYTGFKFFGIPGWIIKSILFKSTLLMVNVFNKNKFICFWISIFRDWGSALEIRSLSSKEKSA